MKARRNSFRAASRLASSLTLAIVALLLGGAPAVAQDDPGRFEIRSADVELESGVYYLDAWLELRLPAEAREALRAGLPVTIRIDVELIRDRRWWVDAEAAELLQRYQLQYHALTERYVVSNLNSGDRSSYSTLFAALNDLGRIRQLPLLDPDRNYTVRVRVVLDMERLPGPLRLLAFWRDDWSITSEWYEWRLDDK